MASRQTASGSGKELASESGGGRVELSLLVALKWEKSGDEVLGPQAKQAVRC